MTVLAAVAGASALAAQDARSHELKQLRSQIHDLEQKASAAVSKEKSALKSIQRLDRLATLRQEEVRLVEERITQVQERVSTSDQRLAMLGEELVLRNSHLVKRMDEVRRVGRLGYVGSVLGRSGKDGFLTALRQLSYLAARDRRRIEGVRTRTEELNRIRLDLQRTNEELIRLKEEAKSAQSFHRQTRARKAQLLKSVRSEKQQALELKREYEQAESRLQSLVGGLAGAVDELPTVPLRLYRGELPWPVRGKILQEFGRVEDSRFDIPFPGIDIAANVGEPVGAVSAGMVVFADWFHGYGKTVCIDHGEGYITVYSHLSVLNVHAGKRVGRGDVIGLVGDTGSLQGAKLYFQLSKDGKPQDPRGWLQR